MQLALMSLAVSALICTGFTVSQDLRSRANANAPACSDEIRNEQLLDIRATARKLTSKWTDADQQLLDTVSVVMAEKLGLSRLHNIGQ